MTTKVFELRDRMTFIPVIAIHLKPEDGRELYLLSQVGFGTTPERCAEHILFGRLEGGPLRYDEFEWGDRTFATAHSYIKANWDAMKNGEVIDVEFLLGETHEAKTSQFLEIQH